MKSAIKSIVIPVASFMIFLSSYISWMAERILRFSHTSSAVLGIIVIILGILTIYYCEGRIRFKRP
ncbi:MAG: hypothetical protein NDF55_04820 [archaeon GB-1867-005]|nr:hypothetical protein [Candidatus Culexmicrobium cathedralense]